jgi:hypothetical protein
MSRRGVDVPLVGQPFFKPAVNPTAGPDKNTALGKVGLGVHLSLQVGTTTSSLLA